MAYTSGGGDSLASSDIINYDSSYSILQHIFVFQATLVHRYRLLFILLWSHGSSTIDANQPILIIRQLGREEVSETASFVAYVLQTPLYVGLFTSPADTQRSRTFRELRLGTCVSMWSLLVVVSMACLQISYKEFQKTLYMQMFSLYREKKLF